jgi:signal transduction histidine kinase
MIALLIDHSLKSNQRLTGYRIRLVLLGATLAFTPILLLSLLPSLLGFDFVPTEINMVWLLFIPLSYGFSISRVRPVWVEKALNRLIVYYLSLILISSSYLLIAEVFIRLIPAWIHVWAWISAAGVVAALFLLTRSTRLIHRLVDWVLYGGERSNFQLLAQLTDTLGLVLSREKLLDKLVDELISTLSLTGSALFLKEGEDEISLQRMAGFDWPAYYRLTLPGNGPLASYLVKTGPILETHAFRGKLFSRTLSPEEARLLGLKGVELWIPLVSGDGMHGLLLLGYKPDDYLLTEGNRQIWQVFARQAGVTAHNVLLTEVVQVSRNELARAHQQLLFSREEERRQIAREIHDNAVQQLLGMSYQIVAIQQKCSRIAPTCLPTDGKLGPELEHLRQELLQTTSQLRDLIGDLRPAGLEEFGLASALEGFAHKLQRDLGDSGPRIMLKLARNGVELPETQAICLFRVAQEAIRNALKHAQANHIYLHLDQSETEMVLSVIDDGCGFNVPVRLSEFTHSNHYGLVGISERVDWVNGHLWIHTAPGRGTEIMVRIPLNSCASLMS